MLGDVANDKNAPSAADNFAFLTNWLDRCSDFHGLQKLINEAAG